MDPLSVTIGIAPVAVGVASAIRKLVQFWEDVKDAPKEHQNLLREFEALSLILETLLSQITSRTTHIDVGTFLLTCIGRLSDIQEELKSLTPGLKAKDRRARTWASLKFIRKEARIELTKKSLESLKLTLLLMNSISTNRAIQQIEEQLLDISETNITACDMTRLDPALRRPSSAEEAACLGPLLHTSTATPPSYHSRSSSFRSDAGQKSTTISLSYDIVDVRNQESFINQTQNHKPSSSPSSGHVVDRGWQLYTPFGTISQVSHQIKTTTNTISGSEETLEELTKWRIFPSRLLNMMGMSYGAWIEASSRKGWQFVITPFNAVPENAPIFQYCQSGDIAKVQALLTLGQASVKDRDPKGRTPLWVATKSLQPNVVELLLSQGADIHAQDWVSSQMPLLAMQSNTFNLSAASREMIIRLYQSYRPEGYDERTMNRLAFDLSKYYRYAKETQSMDNHEKTQAVLCLLRGLLHEYYFSDGDRTFTIFLSVLLDFHFEKDVIHWALRRIKGHILPIEDIVYVEPSQLPKTAMHHALLAKWVISDPTSARLAAEKSSQLHRIAKCGKIWPETPRQFSLNTPLSIAMYHPALFLSFRDLLGSIGCEFGGFIKEELEQSPLADQGWTEATLLLLFKSNIILARSPKQYSRLRCDRCGWDETHFNPQVHLPWRSHLHSIRTGRFGNEEIKFIEGLDHQRWQTVCAYYCCDDMFVAWACDGIHGMPRLSDMPSYVPEISGIGVVQSSVASKKVNQDLCEDECPSKNIPGAYVE
ncbi:hypothetical protein BGZ60DRAFT_256622 [Tricladium varicosporioides]|nr:hypothetical protein BGZ60DRAFT_256622 [Hymenoscyphus varicosporioides]